MEPKQFQDVVDLYNRYDIFRLDVDREPCEPATFADRPIGTQPVNSLSKTASAPTPQTETQARK
jgi:hypothetical protein